MSSAGVGAIRSPRARALAEYIRNSIDATFTRIDTIFADGDYDIVDLTVEPQLTQDRAVAIADAEPIRLMFPKADNFAPVVLSRREDFPLDLVHTNFDRDWNGCCLCVWEEGWHDLSRALTPQALVERIRDWFARTARGELHQINQPLEPLIPAISDTLVIPAGPPPSAWHLIHASTHGEIWTVIVDSEPPQDVKGIPRFPIFALDLPSQVHGAIHGRPRTLEALCRLVEPMGIDLVRVLGDWLVQDEQRRANDRNPLVLVTIPKRRDAQGEVETWENWAFLPNASLGQLGEALGRTFSGESSQSNFRIPAASPARLDEIVLVGWRVVQRLNRTAARVFAGNTTSVDRKLVAIGAGAIGSNVIVNTTRAGVGIWTIIDDDVVLPHNTVRQAQGNRMIGFPKAITARVLADDVLAEVGCEEIVANIINPGEAQEAVAGAFAQADLVVDFSASPSVLGRIADDTTIKRAASLFLNPGGDELVVLAENINRQPRLDEIEAQYFLAAATDTRLKGHFSAARLDFIRYANACQDLFRPLPPWQVHTLCGVAGGRLLTLLESTDFMAHVWRLDTTTGAVLHVPLSPTGIYRHQFDGWRIAITDEVVDRMRAFRRTAAPNETGGVLIGNFDAARRTVHVVAALPAPADSRQAPTYFIRGSKRLKPIVDELTLHSAGSLSYLGEWHSHPDGAAVRPSADDEEVFSHLKRHLEPTGTPYVIAICGKEETWLRAGWQSRTSGEATIVHERT